MPASTKDCVVLVPFIHRIEPDCERGLRELEERGHAVWRVHGYSAIDFARSQIATDAFDQGFEELFWVDSDIVFRAEDIDKIRSHGEPIVAGIYSKKGRQAISCHLLPDTTQITFGNRGQLIEVKYAGCGFLYTKRQVYSDVQSRCELTTCNKQFGRPVVPFFLPLAIPSESGPWYLTEDFAFCHRAREAGYRILADTSVRLFHVGTYHYGWEDAGGKLDRHPTYVLRPKDD